MRDEACFHDQRSAAMPTDATTTRMYIDGTWTDARDGGRLAVINPADESTLAEVAFGGRAEAEAAIDAAARGHARLAGALGLRPPRSSRRPPT